MAEGVRRKAPMPLVQSFVTCRELFSDDETGTVILMEPTSHVPVTTFPTHVRLSIFAEFTGGHGKYQPRLVLRDGKDEVVWGWGPAEQPFECQDPLLPCGVKFRNLPIAVPCLGRYFLALELNGEEVCQRPMWFGPAQAFRSPIKEVE